MERTEKRFANYGNAGLLCGGDGLPHLISDPGLALRYGHAGETLVRPRSCIPAELMSAVISPFWGVLHRHACGDFELCEPSMTQACSRWHCKQHTGCDEVLFMQIPTVGFLYIAGWIGNAGRDYLIATKEETKPREKEYIIDVPMALKFALQGAGWPFRVIRELQKGTLVEDDKNITVSPR